RCEMEWSGEAPPPASPQVTGSQTLRSDTDLSHISNPISHIPKAERSFAGDLAHHRADVDHLVGATRFDGGEDHGGAAEVIAEGRGRDGTAVQPVEELPQNCLVSLVRPPHRRQVLDGQPARGRMAGDANRSVTIDGSGAVLALGAVEFGVPAVLG